MNELITKLIYDHYLNEMARPKVQRTIDSRIWAAMASLCSRTYKLDMGENAKPLGTTKDALLQRYVSGLIIMKQPCPKDANDIDNIKALKQYGHKLVDELNVPIEEIQNLYNENCGNLPKAEVKTTSAPAAKPEEKTTGGFFSKANIDKLTGGKQSTTKQIANQVKDFAKDYIEFTVVEHNYDGVVHRKNPVSFILEGSNKVNYIAILTVGQKYELTLYLYELTKKDIKSINPNKNKKMFDNVLNEIKKYYPTADDLNEKELNYEILPFGDLHNILGDKYTRTMVFIEPYIDDSIGIKQNTNINIGTVLYANQARDTKTGKLKDTTINFTVERVTGKFPNEDLKLWELYSCPVAKCVSTEGRYYKFLPNPQNVITNFIDRNPHSFNSKLIPVHGNPIPLFKYSQSNYKNNKAYLEFFSKAADAKKDMDGIINTAAIKFNWRYDFTSRGAGFVLDVPYRGGYGNYKDYVEIERTNYVPALGELIKLYKTEKELQSLNGFIWSSTLADSKHAWAFDGKKVKALDMEKSTAYLVPLLAFKKNEIYKNDFLNVLCLNPINFYNNEPANFKKRVITKITLNDIKKKYKTLRDIEPVLKKYLKNKCTPDAYSTGEAYKFYLKDAYIGWNYTIDAIELYKGELMLTYWTGGDSTDENVSISFDELPQYPGKTTSQYNSHARTTCKFDYEDMLETAQKFLFNIIKKYGEI